jgi:RHS repeat-associated protein
MCVWEPVVCGNVGTLEGEQMRDLIGGSEFRGSLRVVPPGGTQRLLAARRRGSLLVSLTVAWALMIGESQVQACGNPFDATMCPVTGCDCGSGLVPGSSGISPWLPPPSPPGAIPGGAGGGCPTGTCGSRAGYGRPRLTVSARNQQAVVYDIPLWYASASGPAVEMRLAYSNWDKRYDDPTPGTPPSSYLEMASWPVGRGWTLLYSSTLTFCGDGYQLCVPQLTGQHFIAVAGQADTYYPADAAALQARIYTDSATGLVTYVAEPQGEQLVFEPDPFVSGRYRMKYHYSTRLQSPSTVNYDPVTGSIATVVAGDGATFSFTYDNDGHIVLVEDPFGRSMVLAYSGDFLTGIADMASQAFAFTYDATTGLLTSLTDDSARTTSLNWTPGWSIAVTDPEGHTTLHNWGGSSSASPAGTIGPGGTVVSRELLAKWNRLLWREDAMGNRTYFAESFTPGQGAAYEEVSPAGTITRISRGTNGYRTARKVYDPPAGGINIIQEYGQPAYSGSGVGALLYDERWECTWYTDISPPMPSQVVHRVLDPASGAVLEQTTRTYGRLNCGTPAIPWDDVFPLLSETRLISDGGTPADPGDDSFAETRWDYDAAGRLTAVRQRIAAGEEPAALVTVQSYTYTTAGRLAQATDSASGTRVFTCTARGLVESVTTPGSLVTAFTHDDLNRLTRTDLPGGAFESQTYDCCGAAARTDAAGNVTNYTRFDGRLIAESRQTPGAVSLQSDTFDYDVQGRLVSRTDALDNVTRYTYDRLGRQTAVTAADGSTTRTYYDAEGRPIAEVDAAGHRTETTYDRLGQVLQRRAALNGQMVVVEATAYDGAGRVLSSTDALVNTTLFEFDRLGRTTKVTSPDGTIATSVYDLLGRVVSRTLPHPPVDPAPPTVATVYDAAGRTLSVTDPAGRITSYQYHAEFLRSVVAVAVQADAQATPVTVSTVTYDALGRRASQTSEGVTVEFTYTADGRPLRTTFADGSYTETAYDGSRVTASRDRAGNATAFAYDAIGRRTAVVDARGKSTVTAYVTDTSRPLSVTDPLGNGTGYEYDEAGRLVRVINPGTGTEAERTTLHTYDDLGRRVAVDGARTYPLRYEYDLAGRMTALIDGEGSRTEWSFDTMGRLVRKTYADGTHYDYTYDAQGRLLSRTDALGKTTSYVYNASGQIALVDYPPAGSGAGDPGDTDIAYTYDALGRLAARTDATGAWAWTYDGDTGRALTVTDPDGSVVSYAYDAAGQRDTMALTAAGQQQLMELDYTHTAGRLTGISSSEDLGGVPRTADYSYAYLASSDLLASVVSNNGAADVLTLSRTYDDAGRLLSIASTRPAPLGPVSSFAYGLDALGRRVSRTDLDGSRLDYTYNPRDELTGAVRSDQPATAPFGEYPYSYAYEFDRIGNHLRQVKNGTEFRGRYNNLNELAEREVGGAVRVQGTADGVLPIGVKVDGRAAETQGVDADTAAFRGDSPLRPRQTGEKAISIVATDSNQPPKRTEAVRTVQLPDANPVRFSYDADGNLLSDGRWTYTWTTECRLAAMTPTGPAAASRPRLEYVYDGEGRRRSKKTYSWDAQAEAWVLAAETVFVYDGWNLIRETTTDHTQTPAVTSAKTYVWGLDLSQTLQGAGGVGGLLSCSSASSSSFVAYDGNGNVVALVDASTADVAAEYDYSPFGETLKAAGTAADGNPFRFSTKYSEHPASGPEFYYYGRRYYSPEMGRWTNRDPAEESGGLNLQAFCGNATTTGTDPLGLWEQVSGTVWRAEVDVRAAC